MLTYEEISRFKPHLLVIPSVSCFQFSKILKAKLKSKKIRKAGNWKITGQEIPNGLMPNSFYIKPTDFAYNDLGICAVIFSQSEVIIYFISQNTSEGVKPTPFLVRLFLANLIGFLNTALSEYIHETQFINF